MGRLSFLKWYLHQEQLGR